MLRVYGKSEATLYSRVHLALPSLAFFIDGPLAAFGPPAWLSAAISKELKRLNHKVQASTGQDLLILGIEKSGAFVQHFEDIDQTETPGQQLSSARQYMLLTDRYIKGRILQSDSRKRYGEDTYFGRKFFYKTESGARITEEPARLLMVRKPYSVVAGHPFRFRQTLGSGPDWISFIRTFVLLREFFYRKRTLQRQEDAQRIVH